MPNNKLPPFHDVLPDQVFSNQEMDSVVQMLVYQTTEEIHHQLIQHHSEYNAWLLWQAAKMMLAFRQELADTEDKKAKEIAITRPTIKYMLDK